MAMKRIWPLRLCSELKLTVNLAKASLKESHRRKLGSEGRVWSGDSLVVYLPSVET